MGDLLELEEILSMPTALEPCPGGCDHTEAEHYAFDSGAAAGERGEDEETCPYADGELREAWLTGYGKRDRAALGSVFEVLWRK